MLQAPDRAADAAWTEDAFLEALLDHRSGLSPAAYHELAALQPLAHDGLAVVLDRVPLPAPTQQPRAWGMFVLQRLGTTDPAVVEPWRAWAARWRIAAPCVVRWAFVACIGDGPPGPGWGSPRPCTYDPVPLTVAREALSVTVRGDLLHDTGRRLPETRPERLSRRV